MEESQRNRLNSLDPDKNFIYSENGFIDWMINKQEKTRNTAESYLSSIRTVFQTEFYLDVDNPFSKLSISFAKAKKNFKEGIDNLEAEYCSLVGYIEAVEEYSDIILTEVLASRMTP